MNRIIFAAALAMALPAMAVAAPLSSHRAVYDLTLDKASDRSGISAVTGRIVYEFSGSPCEGYTSNFRYVTRILTDGQQRLTDQRTTTFEEADGNQFTFVTQAFVDQEPDREIKGAARRENGRIAVELAKPEDRALVLDDTLFPTAHLFDMLERAARGESIYETTIYDGSDDADRSLTTSVIIGRKAGPVAGDPEAGAYKAGAPDPAWPVTIAYYDPQSDDGGELPIYRITFKLQEDGVTRDLLMDYGDFSLKGRLVELDMRGPAVCAPR